MIHEVPPVRRGLLRGWRSRRQPSLPVVSASAIPEVITLVQRCAELASQLALCDLAGAGALEVRAALAEERVAHLESRVRALDEEIEQIRAMAGGCSAPLREGRLGRALQQAERRGGILKVAVEADILLQLRDTLREIGAIAHIPVLAD